MATVTIWGGCREGADKKILFIVFMGLLCLVGNGVPWLSICSWTIGCFEDHVKCPHQNKAGNGVGHTY